VKGDANVTDYSVADLAVRRFWRWLLRLSGRYYGGGGFGIIGIIVIVLIIYLLLGGGGFGHPVFYR